MRLNDRIIGLAALAGGAVMIWGTLGFRDVPGQQYGSAFFPQIIGSALMLTGMAVILAAPRGQPVLRLSPLWRGAVLVAVLAWLWLAPVAGFLLGIVLCAIPGLTAVIGVALLAFSAPLLARLATSFSLVEYFWLALLGLPCAAVVSTGSPLKGALSLLFGLFIASIGIDEVAGQPRFTFGSVEQMGSVSFIPAMIGMFSLPEILRNMQRHALPPHATRDGPRRWRAGRHAAPAPAQPDPRRADRVGHRDLAGGRGGYRRLGVLCHRAQAVAPARDLWQG